MDGLNPLDVERARTEAQIVDLTAEFDGVVASVVDDAPDDEHDAEGATVGYERARVAALLANARRHLEALDRAVARRQAGIYDRCVGCGGSIGVERQAALPATDRCIQCAASDVP